MPRRSIRRRAAAALSAAIVAFAAAPALAERAPCPPAPVPGSMNLRTFGERLGERVDACAGEARAPDAARFCARHGLECTSERIRDYVRMRTLFELTRDGGPWRLRWAITNRDPSAKLIWTAWRADASALASRPVSATAECDELSALFAGLARRLEVRRVGLFWPTWNHTIAAWDAAPGVRVLVPTSQIFLACDATFDATTFDPKKQKTVFELGTNDVRDGVVLPADLASFLLGQVTAYAGASLDLLDVLRTHRALSMGSSVSSSCRDELAGAVSAIEGRTLTDADRRALGAYAAELGMPETPASAVLAHVAGRRAPRGSPLR